MLKLFLWKYTGTGTPTNTFTHYWSNEGENFWDTCKVVDNETKTAKINQEWNEAGYDSPLDMYLSDFPGYEWKELEYTRFQRAVIGEMVVEVNSADLNESPTLFFKVQEYTKDEEGNDVELDIPLYYYSKGITFVSDQNLPRTSYRVECNLDNWATFWCYYHSFMKDCGEDFDFMNKMCDRYLFYRTITVTTKKDDGSVSPVTTTTNEYMEIDKKGNISNTHPEAGTEVDTKSKPGYTITTVYGEWTWTIDYTVQTYLMRTADEKTPLYYNDTGSHLSLDDWLNMNYDNHLYGGATSYNSWLPNSNVGIIECSNEKSGIDPDTLQPLFTPTTWTGKTGYVQNQYTVNLKDNSPLGNFDDSKYNCNGKYRYLVVKFGNNYYWGEEQLSPNNDQFNYLITNARNQDIFKTPEGVKIINKIESVISNSLTSKQCITTKVVKTMKEGITYSTLSDLTSTHLNGETLCIIPFPKGESEELYLYYLNSHDKGIVLGDGSILGMVVNDIPPSVLAMALRNYNDNYSICQTIGDKLSTRLNSCPLDIVALYLKGNWDWDPIEFSDTGMKIESGNSFYINSKIKEGYYRTFSSYKQVDPDVQEYRWVDMVDPETNETWNIDYLLNNHPITTLPIITFSMWLLFKVDDGKHFYDSSGNNIDYKRKANWKILAISMGYSYDETTVKQRVKDATGYDLYYYIHLPTQTTVIPPTDIAQTNTYYFVTSLDMSISINYLPATKKGYYNENIKKYFPCIFNDFGYIPVSVAEYGRNATIGSDYFKWFYDILWNYMGICNTNTPEAHPIFYGPGVWRWVYYIDGKNNIQLGADMIDWIKFIKTKTWKVNLNVSFNTVTNYKLDISDIRNEKYPMTRNGLELISQDQTCFPFTVEAFNHWYETNQTTVETSKNAVEISNKYALKTAEISAWTNFAAAPFIGAGQGGAKLGWLGAIIGAVGGVAQGVTGLTELAGTRLENEEAEAQWQNEWNQKLGNLAGSPTQISSSGWMTGSLVYSPSAKSGTEYELFRRYSIPELSIEHIWHNISINGEDYLSSTAYKNYNDRKNFNIVNVNLSDKQYVAMNWMKENMFTISPLFAQQDMIESYIAKCKSKVRLFKCPYDKSNISKIIEDNIEMKLQYATPN